MTTKIAQLYNTLEVMELHIDELQDALQNGVAQDPAIFLVMDQLVGFITPVNRSMEHLSQILKRKKVSAE